MATSNEPASASRVLMIRPVAIAANPETANTNVYQTGSGATSRALTAAAQREFDGLANALSAAGVDVLAFDDTPEPATPDAHFPNNWISFHATGEVVLYPMLAPNRRSEIRTDLLERLEREHGLAWPRLVDLTPLAAEGAILEGTGSLVLDRRRRLAWACLSPRTTPEGLEAFRRALDYELVSFHATDHGQAIYHTNVLMGLGPRFAAVCLAAIGDRDEREGLRASLEATGRELFELTPSELHGFAGNLLALESTRGEALIALSDAAWTALRPVTRRRLERHGTLVRADLTTIERLGGGSARCMLAEVFPFAPARST